MDRWNEYAFPKIAARAKCDHIYSELLSENKILEQEYMELMEKLSKSEQETIERYIASCESIEYRFAQLAYEIGLRERN